MLLDQKSNNFVSFLTNRHDSQMQDEERHTKGNSQLYPQAKQAQLALRQLYQNLNDALQNLQVL